MLFPIVLVQIHLVTLNRVAHIFDAMGHATHEAASLALVEVSHMVTQQTSLLSTLDGFYFMTWVAICGGIFAMFQKRID